MKANNEIPKMLIKRKYCKMKTIKNKTLMQFHVCNSTKLVRI